MLFFYPADFSLICPTEVTGFNVLAEQFAAGAFKGHLAGQALLPAGGKFFLIPISVAALGYAIGSVVQYFFPGITVPAG